MPEKFWFEPLIWTDYRVAILFAVAFPLILLVWAFVQKNETIQRLLIIYWRVSSLLAITVYLMIAAMPISFIAAFMARILIPISLWFWIDLNEDIAEQPQTPLKLSLTSWRWAMTIYNFLGALATIPFLGCAFSQTGLQSRFCNAWFDPPLLYKEYFHANTNPKFLGFMSFVGLVIYIICISYFVLVRLGKQGRSAVEQ